MLAVVKRRRTKKILFEIKGEIPVETIKYLKNKFGRDVKIIEDEEEFVNIFETDWYKGASAVLTPGEALKIYRGNSGFTQATLGMKLGRFTRQKISDMENGKRSISKELAKKLGMIFGVPVERFL